MLSIAVAVIYGIVGVLAMVGAYVAGFVITVYYLALPLLISVPIMLYYLVKPAAGGKALIAPAAGGREPPAKLRHAAMGAIAFSYVSIVMASPISNAQDEARLARGSEVADLVEEYQRITGEFPEHLDELANAGLDVPPELSEGVYYSPDSTRGYVIRVPNDAMMLCVRTAEQPYFFCDD